jgi:hypothetical protein
LLRQDEPDYLLDHAYQAASSSLHVPSSREAARARFLVCTNLAWTDELCNVGEKLLAEREEFDVRFELVKMRLTGVMFDRSRYDRALKMAKELVAKYGSHGKTHSVLAAAYQFGYRHFGMEANRKKAIEEYKLYLASNPPKCYYNQKVKSMIKQLESEAK